MKVEHKVFESEVVSFVISDGVPFVSVADSKRAAGANTTIYRRFDTAKSGTLCYNGRKYADIITMINFIESLKCQNGAKYIKWLSSLIKEKPVESMDEIIPKTEEQKIETTKQETEQLDSRVKITIFGEHIEIVVNGRKLKSEV